MQAALGGQFSVLLDFQGRLWLLGRVDGEYQETYLPKQIPNVTNIKCVSAGAAHMACCTYGGSLLTYGAHDIPQGIIDDGFEIVTNIPPVESVACGVKYTIAIDTEGNAWSYGRNSCGELGYQGDSLEKHPKRIENLKNIVSVACGEFHSLFLDAQQKVYSCGLNTEGQLGQGNFDDVDSPSLIPCLPNVQEIACGNSFSVVLSDSKVLAFGYNYHAELGVATAEYKLNVPYYVPGLSKIADISCGKHHTLCIDTNSMGLGVW